MLFFVATATTFRYSCFRIFKVFNDLSRSQNRSSLGTRYFWPWEADESEKDEENRVDRERLIEFFTTAQNNFLSGPPRK